MRKSNLFKKAIYIINFLTIIDFILLLIFNNKVFYSIYWVLVPLLFVSLLLFNREVDKGNMDVDIYKSKKLKWFYNNATTYAIIFYGLGYLAIEFFDIINNGIKYNIYVICAMLLMTFLYESLLIIVIRGIQKNISANLDRKGKK